MNFAYSKHVQVEMERRGIPLAVVATILAAPGQKVPEHAGIICYQSKVEINRRMYLVRVMVNETVAPAKVVTAYRTAKIEKYWRPNP